MNKEKPILSIRDLHTNFYTDLGVIKAVRGVNLDVFPGKTLCLVGESGSGKSITAYSALRLIDKPGKIDQGSILYNDMELTDMHEDSKAMREIRGAQIAMITQEPMTALSPVHRVGDQIIEAILLHNKISKAEAKKRVVEIMRQSGIPEPDKRYNQYPHEMSGGLRQRIVISMALCCYPKLLIADEPTTALDVTIQAQILDLIVKFQKDLKMAVMFITHDLGVVAQIADEVAVMYLGRIVERADVNTLFARPQHPYTKALLKSMPGLNDNEYLETIRGSVPEGSVTPPGCAFYERCDHGVEGKCDDPNYFPQLNEIEKNHQVACYLHEPKEVKK